MDAAMECNICTQRYNFGDRIPKVMPCGHTACLQCLWQVDHKCPRCRKGFRPEADGLSNNYGLLDVLDAYAKDSLARHLKDTLPQAADQLEDLRDQTQGEQALQAVTLMSTESWDLTLRGEGCVLTGTLRNNTKDPLMMALHLILATRVQLKENPNIGGNVGANRPPPVQAAPRIQRIQLVGPPPAGRNRDRHLEEEEAVVRRLQVRCNTDHTASLTLLQAAAPAVEELMVCNPRSAHLLAVCAMPRLKRLELRSIDGALDTLPPLLPVDVPAEYCGLQWLRVSGLPRITLQSLLQAHGRTLEVLRLRVGTQGDEGWPINCNDLHDLLQQCDLRVMRRLVLVRGLPYCHWRGDCFEQRGLVRRALQGNPEVMCSECDGLEAEDSF
ncbi:uncharacterized protein LOC113204522 [Frankliniella occidentalis]|uniref:Uncharacterized protein LOC113204522 n=1 Tax=Frankliniella occidentalis TaxID=133901 RepID=A0A6J1S2R4_FRAOC|nr:uncharacterized protein LOC113204522 [Frankliniella occidentalis]XP_052120705.1 uncharacterized protein LOC113204522 [Frankliniella occidentalis]XP_052120706.1 uncharacterized protein LOC113204522 [Frankliniella occidentalis]